MSNETNLYEIPNYVMHSDCNDEYRAGGVAIYCKDGIQVLSCKSLNSEIADSLNLEFLFFTIVYLICYRYIDNKRTRQNCT